MSFCRQLVFTTTVQPTQRFFSDAFASSNTSQTRSCCLTGKKAFIAGVADDQGFGWAIAKALAEAGAEISLGVWVRDCDLVFC